jgi:hypothetical protein
MIVHPLRSPTLALHDESLPEAAEEKDQEHG